MSVAQLEPLLTDSRVERLAEALFLRFPALPLDSEVVTFISPERKDQLGRVIPAGAVFAVVSGHPRARVYGQPGMKMMTHAGVWLERWRLEEKGRKHFVSGRDDPAFKFLFLAAKEHLRKIDDLKSLIN